VRLLVIGPSAQLEARSMAGANPLKFLQEVRQEAGKITWPTRNETLISTIMVLIMVTLASLFFLASDQVISWLVQLMLSIR
jgi:preprotein translocase subunit SecE